MPATARTYTEYPVWWIDPERAERLDAAIARDEAFAEDTNVDVDPYGIRSRLEARRAGAARGE